MRSNSSYAMMVSRTTPKTSVLVGILKTRRDLDILLRERWYRIPVGDAPRRPFRYLAFYQPAAFGRDKKRIRYYARVLRRETRPRRDLLPLEPSHPHAGAAYYRIHVGPAHELPHPVRNIHPRRVSFGFTTLDRLRTARTILELYNVPDTEELMVRAFRKAGVRALPQRYVTGGGKRYRLDFAIVCRNGKLAIECDNRKAHAGQRMHARDRAKNAFLRRHGWTVIRLTESAIVRSPERCATRVRRAIRKLGGQLS